MRKKGESLTCVGLFAGIGGIELGLDRESHREIREKVTGKLLTLDRTLEPTLPALLALLDVPVEDAHWQALGRLHGSCG